MENNNKNLEHNSTRKKRVLVIGWDSATWSLLKPWMDNGELPTLHSLMKSGSYGKLISTIPPLSPVAWTSFATGQNPGKHGVFDHRLRDGPEYKPIPINSTYRMCKPIWSIVSEHNKNVGLINIPMTFPADPVRGTMITGMYTPSERADYTFPKSLKSELAQAVGGYSIFRRRTGDLELDFDGLLEIMEMRFRTADYLLSSKPWDLFTIVFQATDAVQHWFWKYMDSSHPDYSISAPRKFRSAILDVYRRADEILDRLLQHVDNDTYIILMSDHGAGPFSKSFHLDTWLLREGFLRLRRNARTWLKQLIFRSGVDPQRMMSLILKTSPIIHGRIAEQVLDDRHHANRKSILQKPFLASTDIDWSRTLAYSPGGNFPGIHINVKGREIKGCVSPGKEYEDLRDVVRQRLLTIKDPEFNVPVVRGTHLSEEIFDGQFIDRAPDIVIDFNENYHVFGAHDFASSALIDKNPWFSGEHRSDGIIVISGPKICQDNKLSNHHLVDVMPTILYLLNCPIPTGLDGKAIKSAFTAGYFDNNPPHFMDIDIYNKDQTQLELSPEDEKAVEDRLRDLGYI